MDSLSDLLKTNQVNVPPEILRIKDYISKKYDEDVSVKQVNNKLIITSKSSTLSASLRLNYDQIKQIAGTDKKISFITNN